MHARILATLAVCALIVAAPAAWATPDDPHGDDWVAIAHSPGSPIPGGYGGSGTPEGAAQIALTECQTGSPVGPCMVIVTIEYGCVAVAINTKNGQWAGGRGADMAAANEDAAAKLPPFQYGDVRSGGKCSTPATPP